ncbi:MAG: hypothetical protein AAFY71_24310 [Bacteroidota bacterium]
MIRHLLLLASILLFSSCIRPVFEPLESCEEIFTLVQGENFCPHGMMFKNEKGQKVFVDMFIIDYSSMDLSPLRDLNKGDKIAMTVEELDQENWLYHVIDYACEEKTDFPDPDLWTQVNCIETLKEQAQ